LRQRKDKAGEKRYSITIMNDISAIPETLVADLFKSNPGTVSFFIHQPTACVGCYLAKFCTVKDVINTYQLNRKVFLEKLAAIIIHKTS
jgi:hypothetical protein